jgi:hypothetical protein
MGGEAPAPFKRSRSAQLDRGSAIPQTRRPPPSGSEEGVGLRVGAYSLSCSRRFPSKTS